MVGKDTGSQMENCDSLADAELTDTQFDATPEEVKAMIEDTVAALMIQLRDSEEPTLSVVARTNKNAIFCKKEQQVRLGNNTVKRKLSDGKRFQGMWKILHACYSLMKEHKSVNQRELYYLNTDVTLSSIDGWCLRIAV